MTAVQTLWKISENESTRLGNWDDGTENRENDGKKVLRVGSEQTII